MSVVTCRKLNHSNALLLFKELVKERVFANHCQSMPRCRQQADSSEVTCAITRARIMCCDILSLPCSQHVYQISIRWQPSGNRKQLRAIMLSIPY